MVQPYTTQIQYCRKYTNKLPLIHRVCEIAGYTPTTICTPLELLWEVS